MAYRDWAGKDVEHKLVCGLIAVVHVALHIALWFGRCYCAGAQNRNLCMSHLMTVVSSTFNVSNNVVT